MRIGGKQLGPPSEVPAMPCLPCQPSHRERILKERPFPFNAAVARPVSRNELRSNSIARESMDKEWRRLRDQIVWDEDHPYEWDSVRRDAQQGGDEGHLGYLLGICVEKNSERADGDPLNKYKGRGVFQGNFVVNQNYDAAMFQDLGSAPATMEAAKIADFFGCAPNHTVEIAEAVQAYVQADMKGTPTWVCLPEGQRPAWWKKKYPNMRRPVCRLWKALYGHPDAGTFWEEKCDKHVTQMGFESVDGEWPSCYFHPALRRFLVIYVDDFKLAGPKESVPTGWELIQRGIDT